MLPMWLIWQTSCNDANLSLRLGRMEKRRKFQRTDQPVVILIYLWAGSCHCEVTLIQPSLCHARIQRPTYFAYQIFITSVFQTHDEGLRLE